MPRKGQRGQIDQRASHRDADVAGGIGVLPAHVLHQSDAADRQQDDGAYGYAATAGHQRVSHLVQDNATEDNTNQCRAPHRTHSAHGHRLGEPDEGQQKEERQVDANVHSEETSRGE